MSNIAKLPEINSVDDFLKQLPTQIDYRSRFVYRRQNKDWELVPKLFRDNVSESALGAFGNNSLENILMDQFEL